MTTYVKDGYGRCLRVRFRMQKTETQNSIIKTNHDYRVVKYFSIDVFLYV